jgi:NitT/TauT family transport system substrate-binding protein
MALGACNSAVTDGGGNGKGGATTMKVSYSEVVADELPLWIAEDSGLFKKHGLSVSLVNLSSSDGFPALVSGQTQLASIGASEMVSGAASGAKVSYLATLTPVFPYELYAKVPASQLKGKRIGITTTSGSLYIATLEALKQLGLSPDDVKLVPLGSVTNVNNSLVSGTIDAAMTHPPATAKLQAAGYHSILDLAKQKIPTSNVGIAGTKSYISGHKKQVQDFIDALMEGIKREKSDKSYALKTLAKHLQITDQKALEETYSYYADEVLPDVPTPTTAQLATSQKVLGADRSDVAKLDLSNVVDSSFVKAGS